jgi:hypothetical protein
MESVVAKWFIVNEVSAKGAQTSIKTTITSTSFKGRVYAQFMDQKLLR